MILFSCWGFKLWSRFAIDLSACLKSSIVRGNRAGELNILAREISFPFSQRQLSTPAASWLGGIDQQKKTKTVFDFSFWLAFEYSYAWFVMAGTARWNRVRTVLISFLANFRQWLNHFASSPRLGMGGFQVGSVLRVLFALGILSVHQLSVTGEPPAIAT